MGGMGEGWGKYGDGSVERGRGERGKRGKRGRGEYVCVVVQIWMGGVWASGLSYTPAYAHSSLRFMK